MSAAGAGKPAKARPEGKARTGAVGGGARKRARIALVHWNADEAAERVDRLAAAGYHVHALHDAKAGMPALRAMVAKSPAAFVIDLSRIPSQGRAIATALRRQKSTRHLRLVFVGGEEAKVARVRQAIPDATYTTWRGIRGALRRALAAPVSATPRVPGTMDAYSRTPLPRKLGIREDARVLLLGAPEDFERTLDPLPEGARVTRRPGRGDRARIVLLFARTQAELRRRLPGAVRAADARKGLIWIVWPKKTSGMAKDLGERGVRETGLAAGLVDFKICAVDDVWSGLCFTPRRRQAS